MWHEERDRRGKTLNDGYHNITLMAGDTKIHEKRKIKVIDTNNIIVSSHFTKVL